MDRFDIVILPVCGLASDGMTPDANGIARIEKCARLVESGAANAIAFSGGANVPKGTPSVAERYAMCFRKRYPHLASAIKIVDARGNSTNRDLVALRLPLNLYLSCIGVSPGKARIGVVSLPCHLKRIGILMRHLGYAGYAGIETQEPGFYPAAQWLLNFTTWIDPGWRWLGAPLEWLNARRVYNNSKIPD